MNPEFEKSFPCENICISRKDVADMLVNSGMLTSDAMKKATALTDWEMLVIVETFENIFFDDGFGEYQTILLKSFEEFSDDKS